MAINDIVKIDVNTRKITQKGSKLLGIQGENRIQNLVIELSEYIAGTGWLEIELPDGTKKILEMQNSANVYVLPIKSSLLSKIGTVTMAMHIICDGQQVFKSLSFEKEVEETVNGEQDLEEQYPSILQDITIILNQTKAVKAETEVIKSDTQAIYDETQEFAEETTENMQQHEATTKSYADLAVSNANASSVNKDLTDKNVGITEENKQTTENIKNETNAIKEETARLKQDVIQLMSTDTKSYFFSTIAERDNATGIRHCDRCSVLETRADYIYDMHDTDEDDVTPEWIKTSDWDALKTVAWEIITGKPNFHTVATSGSYNDLKDKPNRYEGFLNVSNGVWDYNLSDKIILDTTDLVSIDNVYNGAVGVIVTTLDLTLPDNSKKSADFDYIEVENGEHYMYMFIFDGNYYHWTRTACV